MRFYIIAGEASGDLYGSILIESLKVLDSKAIFRFWGGVEMSKKADGLFHDYKDSSYMGFKDIFLNIGKLSKLFSATKNDILSFKPDVIIYIDYPGFNLRMSKWSKKNGYRNVFFICPKIWAWKKNRYKALKKYIDQLICILPFEIDFLANLGISGEYHGHPMINLLDTYKWKKENLLTNTIGLLPGSRRSELKYILPILNDLVRQNPTVNFELSIIDSIELEFYRKYIDFDLANIKSSSSNYKLLTTCKLALVCSGTATLEAAIIGTPQIVIYKADQFSYEIAKRLVKLNYISLPNLICDRAIVKEIIQNDLSVLNIEAAIKELSLEDNMNYLFKDYSELIKILQSEKSCIKEIASSIVYGIPNIKD